jgi:Rho-binding antiterminator
LLRTVGTPRRAGPPQNEAEQGDDMEEYQPIDCGMHDRLESYATLRQPCRITFRDDDGRQQEAHDRIDDIFAEDGVEYIRTGAGGQIRLDRIDNVDGLHGDAPTEEDAARG